ncbi:MAG: site-specific DNA-methyltransferase [Polyangiaceae bacterium]|nr:site-specific DNA-methyltransferase [Polyangiaceae bacterium]
MEKLDPKKDGASPDVVAENLERMRELFPEVFAEGKVDFEALRETLGEYVEDKQERYSFTWHGKGRARRIAQTPSTGTLLPCPEESVDWGTTQNVFIEGDNLEVLKLLQKSYHRRVKMIYIDPPYNTGKEFIYPDKYQDNLATYLRYTGQVTGEGFKLSSNAETSGRYHTNWLNMMYPRLKLARNLLRDDGAILISIDDHESANLRKLCDEVFGEENFKADIAWQKRYTRSNNTVDFTTVVEHVMVYARSDSFVVNLLPRTDEADARYTNPDNDPRGPWKGASFLNPATPAERPNLCYPIKNPNTGEVTNPTTNAWRRAREEFDKLQADNRLYWGGDGRSAVPSIKMFLSEARGLTPVNFWEHGYAGNTDDGTRDLAALLPGKVFDNPKPVNLIRRAIEHVCTDDDIILDFFAGSGVTGEAAYRHSIESGQRVRYILVQLPESTGEKKFGTISEICRQRLVSAGAKLRGETDVRLALASGAGKSDLGFRFFRLASSNIKAWDADFDMLDQALLNAVENIKPERSEDDVLYEVLLKYGLDLAIPIESRTVKGKKIYIIGAGALVVCLATGVTLDVVEGIAALKDELKPEVMRVVFRDAGFADDVVKTNTVQILNQAGIDDVKSL